MPDAATRIPWTRALRPDETSAAPAPRTRRARFGLWWRRWDRAILGGVAATAFALGWRGAALWDDSEFSNKGWHPASTALKLFFLNGPSSGSLPWQLEIARFLAPLLTLYAAGMAMLALARDRWEGLRVARLARKKGYTVVIGCGNIGARLVADFRRGDPPQRSGWASLVRRRRERPILVLERDATGPAARRARELRAVVVAGDARSLDDVAVVHPERASLVTVFCGDDAQNLAALAHIRTLRRRLHAPRLTPSPAAATPTDTLPGATGASEQFPTLRCVVHVSDARLRSLVSRAASSDDDRIGLRVEYVGLYEQAARRACADVLAEAFAGTDRRDEMAHLVVVGLGQLGEELVLEAARSPHFVPEAGPCLHVTVVDREADARVASLRRRFPALAESIPAVGLEPLVSLRPRELRLHDGVQLAAIAAEIERDAPKISAIAVCLEDEATGLAIACEVHDFAKTRGIPVLLRLSNERGLADVVRCHDGLSRELSCVQPFAVLDDLGTRDLVESTDLDRTVHETYRQTVNSTAAPEHEPTRPAASHEWETLAVTFQNASRAQARHIPWKLARLNLGVARADDVAGPSIPGSEVESLAMLEHARWVAERRLQGWTHGDDRDDPTRVHPDVRPWDATLKERSKAFDRAAVTAIPTMLKAAGLKTVPLRG